MLWNLPLISALVLLARPAWSDWKTRFIDREDWQIILLVGFWYAFTWTSAEALAFVFSFALLWVGLNFVPDKELAVGDKNIILALSVLTPQMILPVLSVALVGLQVVSLVRKKPSPFVPFLFFSFFLFLFK